LNRLKNVGIKRKRRSISYTVLNKTENSEKSRLDFLRLHVSVCTTFILNFG